MADALRRIGWDIVAVHEEFNAKPTDAIKDERIIPRAAREQRAWVTLDLAARREHAGKLARHKISVLWVTQPKNGFNTAYQFAVLSWALLYLDRELSKMAGQVRSRKDWVDPTRGT